MGAGRRGGVSPGPTLGPPSLGAPTPGPRVARVTSQLPSPTEAIQEGQGALAFPGTIPHLAGHTARAPRGALPLPHPPRLWEVPSFRMQGSARTGCWGHVSRWMSPPPPGRMQACVYGLHLGSPVGLPEENSGQSGEPPETGLQGAFLSRVNR